jgi:hypothetical protein
VHGIESSSKKNNKESNNNNKDFASAALIENDIASVWRANSRRSAAALRADDPWWGKAAGCAWLVACQTLGFLLLPLFDVWITAELARTYGAFFLRKHRHQAAGRGGADMNLGDLFGHTRKKHSTTSNHSSGPSRKKVA